LQEERDRLQQELGGAKERHDRWLNEREQLACVKADVASAERTLEKENQYLSFTKKEKLPVLRAREADLAKVQNSLDTMAPPATLDDSPIRQLEREIELEARAIPASTVIEASMRVKIEERRNEEIELSLERAEKNPWYEVIEIAEKLGPSPETDRLRALAKENLGDLGRIRTCLESSTEALEVERENERKAIALDAKAEAQKMALAAKRDQLVTMREEADRKQKEQNAGYERERAALVQNRDCLQATVGAFRTDIAQAEASHDLALRRLESLKSKESVLPVPPSECPDGADIESRLLEVASQLDRQISANALRQEIDNLMAAIVEEQAERDVYSATEWAIQRKREQDLSAAGGPLLNAMREFMKAAQQNVVPYITASAGVCSIGLRKSDGTEITIQALSGGEWTFFAAALAAAVILTRNSEIKVLLVEAAEADEETLEGILNGIKSIKGNLDAAIVMTAHDSWNEGDACVKDWNIIEL
jgi:hypothetical protein